MKRYCATCDRIHPITAKFCGNCGQKLDDIGQFIEKYTFTWWLPIYGLFVLLLGGMVSLSIAFTHTHWAFHMYNVVSGNTDYRFLLALIICFVCYIGMMAFLLKHFARRRVIVYGRIVTFMMAIVGLIMSSYQAFAVYEIVQGHTAFSDELRAHIPVEQLENIYPLVFATFIVLAIFYSIALLQSVRRRLK